MYVYSHLNRICETGLLANRRDSNGKELYTGDIAIIFAIDKHGIAYVPNYLTVVVMDQFTTHHNGTQEVHELNRGCYNEPYIMGIGEDSWDGNKWKIVKVKDHCNVVKGENWKAYGFNYGD